MAELSKEVRERRQAAWEVFYDGADISGFNAPEEAIEAATRVRITPEIIEATQGSWPEMTPQGWLNEALTRAFRAAGFEVEEP